MWFCYEVPGGFRGTVYTPATFCSSLNLQSPSVPVALEHMLFFAPATGCCCSHHLACLSAHAQQNALSAKPQTILVIFPGLLQPEEERLQDQGETKTVLQGSHLLPVAPKMHLDLKEALDSKGPKRGQTGSGDAYYDIGT